MRDERIVYLDLRSFPAYVSVMQHVYADLHCNGESVSLEKTLTAAEARTMKRPEPDFGWEEGDTTSRLASNDEATRIALKEWHDHFPGATVLIEGQSSTAEPQTIIAGFSPERRMELNLIFMECEKLGWWDGGNEEDVQALSDKWFALFDQYLEGGAPCQSNARE
jgi:hypothetical protein